MNNQIRWGFAGLLAVTGAAVFWLAGCGGPAKSAATSPQVPEEGRSAPAAAIAQHLEYGGEFYGVIDVRGSLEEVIQPYLGMVTQMSRQPGSQVPPLDYAALVKRLGLYGIEGGGMSSWRKPGELLFHNREFVYVPAGREGLLKILGGPAGPLVTPSLAPGDADLVIEFTVDVKSVADLVLESIREIGGATAVAQVMQTLRQPVAPGAPITWQWLLDHSNTRATVVARLDDKQTLDVGAPLAVPRIELAIGLDGFAELFTTLEPLLKEGDLSQIFSVAEKNGVKTATWEFTLPQPWDGYKPLIASEAKSGRLYIVSSPGFAEATIFGQGSRLSGSADFKAATAGFPSAGNSLIYVSSDALKEGIKLYQGTMALMPADAAMLYNPAALDAYAKLPHGIASFGANLPDGVFSQSNWPQSNKQVLAMGPAVLVGLLSAMAIPAFNKVRLESRNKTVMNNLRQIASGAQQYMLDKGVISVRYIDLIAPGPDQMLRPVTPVMGESYDAIVVRQTDETISVTLPDGRVITYNM